jgi:carboxymethylenebutenolidase
MGEMIRMKMSDVTEIAVYRAGPPGRRRGGLVLIQEIFGVTDHIRQLAQEYAAGNGCC